MAFKPNDITKDNILDAIKKIEKENIQLKPATRWHVMINEKPYPPKEVMKYAHRQMNGEELWNYGGGEGTNKYLKKFGFEMVDMREDAIQKLILEYKKHIQESQLNDEKYKWELLSKYKGRPNLEAENLLEEVKSINFANLIYALGKAVVYHLINDKPEEMRLLFKNLFNEDLSLTERIKSYNVDTLNLYRSIGQKLQHHQDERTIGTFLTFHNPDKYTFYKYSFYKKMCELLSEKEAKKNEKYEHYLSLVNRIIEDYIQDDTELIDLVKSYISDYYDGSNHLLLTQDILYQMLDKKETKNFWLYAPGINANKWDEFYSEGIMGLGWDNLGDLDNYATKNEIKKKLQKLEDVDSSKQNDTAANYDFHKVIKEGDIIIVKKGISELLGYGEVISEYYYDESRDTYQKCRKVDWKLRGNWKVDFSLPIKTLTDITKYPTEDINYSKYYEKLMAIMENPINSKSNEKDVLNFNTPLNQILYGPPGTGKTYNSINKAIKIINPNFDLTQERETVKKEFDRLVAEGQIVFTTFHQSMSYEDFIEGIKPKIDEDANENRQVVYEIEDGIFKRLVDNAKKVKTASKEIIENYSFDDAWDDLVNEAERNLESKNPLVLSIQTPNLGLKIIEISERGNLKLKPIYSEDAKEYTVSYSRAKKLQEAFPVLSVVKNIDKEFRAVIGGSNSTAYWSILNYINQKINQNSKVIKQENTLPAIPHVLIIDEINRGNVSQIFGELITLIEESKRLGEVEALEVTLSYSKKKFGVPSNVYIIGTMNTADRSVEALDTALRRRFSFVEMMPDEKIFDSLNFTDTYDRKGIMQKINQRIEVLLDRNYTLGHSYFIKEDFKNSFENEIIPLLQEYFYNDYGKIGLVLGKGFVREKAITAKNDKSIFADFDTKNEVDINKSYELIPFTEFNFDEVIKTLLA